MSFVRREFTGQLRAGALMIGQHWQVRDPGTDLISVLFGHHPRDLCQVSQIVHHPGREQLA
jgi:hypothetical protein